MNRSSQLFGWFQNFWYLTASPLSETFISGGFYDHGDCFGGSLSRLIIAKYQDLVFLRNENELIYPGILLLSIEIGYLQTVPVIIETPRNERFRKWRCGYIPKILKSTKNSWRYVHFKFLQKCKNFRVMTEFLANPRLTYQKWAKVAKCQRI